MRREKTDLTFGEQRRAGWRYDGRPLPFTQIILVALAAMLALSVAGCTLLPREYSQEPPRKTAGLQAMDEYAWRCYDLGIDYMDQSRFELARQQFSLAASSAVSKTLHEDALDAMRRAEQSIRQQR
ncbi:MAG: hypothetical protein M0P70_08255 [Desulfobulbaceae bacterium]|nr:hypothetical protein [Desulfobulbaceae bacterium]